MIWFGSSAGVALCAVYRDARSVTQWLRTAWWIIPAYAVGFVAMLAIWPWHPDAPATTANVPVSLTR